jgi:hypothetical protein
MMFYWAAGLRFATSPKVNFERLHSKKLAGPLRLMNETAAAVVVHATVRPAKVA